MDHLAAAVVVARVELDRLDLKEAADEEGHHEDLQHLEVPAVFGGAGGARGRKGVTS